MRVNLAAVQQQALLNMIVQPIWDTVAIATTNSAAIQLFNATANKSLIATNMVQPGMIPSPDQFIARGFMIDPVQDGTYPQVITTITDGQRFVEKTMFSFVVGSNKRKIIEISAKFLPAGVGMEGFVTTGGATSVNVAHLLGNGVRRLDNRFALTDKFAELLRSNEAFSGFFNFPDAPLLISVAFSARCTVPGLWSQSIG